MTAQAYANEPDARRFVEVAVRYATHGWPVVPLHTPVASGCSCRRAGCGSPGKHPRTARGLHDASTNDDQISAWWQRWPDANLGVVTGADSGLLVLDIDLPDGPASLARLEAEHAALPATCEQRTGSGGRQLLFAHPGHSVSNRTRLEPGIDVRGDGGYIVVPPSAHVSGGRYQWTGHVPPATPPDWLLRILDRTRTPHVPTGHPPSLSLPTGPREQRYAESALQREVSHVAGAVEGSRNDTLNRAAFNLGQLTGSGLLSPERVVAELERAAIDVGLSPVEARRTIASGLAAGCQHPRIQPAPSSLDSPSVRTPVRRLGARHR